MPSFDTPAPISAVVELDAGTARITAGKRLDTIVEVLPANGADKEDVRAVQQTEVSCSGGRLTVRTPKKRSLFGRPGSIVVSIELPAGSDVRGTTALGNLICEGPLGEVRLKTSLGDVRVDEAARAELTTDHGDIRLDRSTGDAEITGSGRVEIGAVAGAAVVKNGNGTTGIDEVGGELKANAANGDISVGTAGGNAVAKSANGRIEIGTALAGVEATSSNGRIRVGDVVRGRIALRTSVGDIEVGIRRGTAAWLDLEPKYGTVRNNLGAAAGPRTPTRPPRCTPGRGPGTSSSAAPDPHPVPSRTPPRLFPHRPPGSLSSRTPLLFPHRLRGPARPSRTPSGRPADHPCLRAGPSPAPPPGEPGPTARERDSA